MSFCKQCIEAATAQDKKCPACKGPYQAAPPHKMVSKYLNASQFKCDECPAVVQYSNMPQHKLQHLESKIECPLSRVKGQQGSLLVCNHKAMETLAEVKLHLSLKCVSVHT